MQPSIRNTDTREAPVTEADRRAIQEKEKLLSAGCSTGSSCIYEAEFAAAKLLREGKAKTPLEALHYDNTEGAHDSSYGNDGTPVIVLRFEADDAAALGRIQQEFRRVLLEAKPGSELPF